MKKNIVWLVLSCLMVLALLAASCAKAEEKAPAPAAKEAAPAVKEAAPAVKEAAPEVIKEAAPVAGAEMVKVRLTKLDGTVVEKMREKPRYGGTFTYLMTGQIFGFDAISTVQWRTNTLHWTNDKLAIGEWTRSPLGTGETSNWGSVYADPRTMVPHLAERWEMPDSDTIIYYLRQGVRFQNKPPTNGREMTADDVVFSLKLFWETPISYVYTNFPVSERPVSIRKIDKYTVEVKNSPEMHIAKTHETIAGYVFIYPQDAYTKFGDFKKWENSVGTGPFILTDHIEMSSATLKRNPTHFGVDPFFPENQMPYVDTVRVIIITDRSTQMAAMRTGKVDLMAAVPSYDDIESLLKTNPDLRWETNARGGEFIAGRMDKPELPFKDIRVRYAMNMAIDSPSIIKDYMRGYGVRLPAPVAKIMDFKDMYTNFEDLSADIQEIYTYNPTKAKQLLAEAGYPNGFTTQMDLQPAYADYAQIIQGYLADVGINVKLNVHEAGVWGAIEQGRTHKEMLYRYYAITDPFGFWDTHPLRGHNAAMVNDPWINNFREEIAKLVCDEPKRRKLYTEKYIPYFYKQAFYIIQPDWLRFQAWQPWLKGFEGGICLGTGHYNGPASRYGWIDQELKKAMGFK